MKNKKTIKILSIILAIALLVIGIFVFVNNKNNGADISQNQNINTKSTEPVKTIVNGVDISDWKTYRNEEYGYSIKYPEDWELREFPGTGTGASFAKDNHKIVIESEGSSIGQFNGSFDEYINKLSHSVNDNQYDLMEKFITIFNIKGYTINWNESMRDYGMGAIFNNVYFEAKKDGFYKNRKVIKIRYNSWPIEHSIHSTKIFNTMTQTFDYID